MIPDTLTRTQRTGVQAVGGTGVVLLISYLLSVCGLNVPMEVIVTAVAMAPVAMAKLMNFAEEQGWIKDRKAV